MKYQDIVIYGGTSEIALELIKIYFDECNKIIVFCTNKNRFFDLCNEKQILLEKQKIEIFEIDILDLEKNLQIVEQLKNSISGIFWITGKTGDGSKEYLDLKSANKNLSINFVNPTLMINELSKKVIINKNSFIAVFTSVAGLRGRKKQLFYSSGKAGLISYLSGLRQKVCEDKILVTTIIPGYMNTKPFKEGNWNSLKFLITEPDKVALKIKKAIQNKKEIIYINYFWKIIMIIIMLIPEKIFKRLSF